MDKEKVLKRVQFQLGDNEKAWKLHKAFRKFFRAVDKLEESGIDIRLLQMLMSTVLKNDFDKTMSEHIFGKENLESYEENISIRVQVDGHEKSSIVDAEIFTEE